jgi:arachidonate 5-lipoxygenase
MAAHFQSMSDPTLQKFADVVKERSIDGNVCKKYAHEEYCRSNLETLGVKSPTARRKVESAMKKLFEPKIVGRETTMPRVQSRLGGPRVTPSSPGGSREPRQPQAYVTNEIEDQLSALQGVYEWYIETFDTFVKWWDVTLLRRVLMLVATAVSAFMVVTPHEMPKVLVLLGLHLVGVLMRVLQPCSKEEHSFEWAQNSAGVIKSQIQTKLNLRDGHGFIFRLTVLLSFLMDLVSFMHLTPLYVVSLVVPVVRGQTLGMMVYGLQCVKDPATPDHKILQVASPLQFLTRHLLNVAFYPFAPLTILWCGKLPGSWFTATTLVIRPQPKEPSKGPGPLLPLLWNAFKLFLPVAVGVMFFVLSATILAGQGITGTVIVERLWFDLTATSGADAWFLEQYKGYPELPQYLSKEGGAMWFGFAPYQLANIDPDKYVRFLQQTFSLKNTLTPAEEAPQITSFDTYAELIPEVPRSEVWNNPALGATGYLNIFNALSYLPRSLWHRVAAKFGMSYQSDDVDMPMIEAIYRPPLSKTWKKDEELGRQQIIGANPMSINWAKDGVLPKAFMTEAVKDRRFETLQNNSKLFYTDYKILQEIARDYKWEGRYLYPAIGVFYTDEEGDMQPLAIQLTQDGGDRVFTPKEKNPAVWLFAKMHLQHADGIYHQMVVHLLQCHLSLEPVIVSMQRHLKHSVGTRHTGHAVADLLMPHFHRTIAINSFGRHTMLGGSDPNSPPTFDVITSIGVNGTLGLMQKAYLEEWGMVDNSFPKHLEKRGFTRTEPAFLKDFPYRDDGFLVWDAMKDYVKECLSSVYQGDRSVENDQELQAWITDMKTKQSEGGANVNGVPDVKTVAALTELLTSIIWQASAQHSAVNFGQWEYYSFIPNRPLSLSKEMPVDADKTVTDEYILGSLPTVDEVYLALVTGRSLTLPTNRPLLKKGSSGEGAFGHSKWAYPVRFPDALKHFSAMLQKVEDEVTARNARRKWPYPYLQPSKIPSSIAI